MNLKKLFFPRAYQYEAQPYAKEYDIRHVSRKGKQLEYILFSKGHDRLVILCHPYLIEAKDFYLQSGHISMYEELGYDVMIFDFNGFGNSDDIDLDMHKDLALLSIHAKNELGYKKIYAHGISMGAAMIINCAHTETHKIDKIIVENCLDETASYFKKRNKKLYFLMTGINKALPFIGKRTFYYKDIAGLRITSEALLLYNDEDDLTTVEMGEKLSSRINIPAEMHVLKGTHLSAIETDREKYMDLITSFLEEA